MGVAVRASVGKPEVELPLPLPYEIKANVRMLYPRREWEVELPKEDYEPLYTYILEMTGVGAYRRVFDALTVIHAPEREPDQRLVLLCFCTPQTREFCHRRIFAEWYEQKTGIPVPELYLNPATGVVEEVPDPF